MNVIKKLNILLIVLAIGIVFVACDNTATPHESEVNEYLDFSQAILPEVNTLGASIFASYRFMGSTWECFYHHADAVVIARVINADRIKEIPVQGFEDLLPHSYATLVELELIDIFQGDLEPGERILVGQSGKRVDGMDLGTVGGAPLMREGMLALIFLRNTGHTYNPRDPELMYISRGYHDGFPYFAIAGGSSHGLHFFDSNQILHSAVLFAYENDRVLSDEIIDDFISYNDIVAILEEIAGEPALRMYAQAAN